MPLMPTASSLGRAIKCPGSAMLPVTHIREPGEGAKRGTALHKCMEVMIKDGNLNCLEADKVARELGVADDWNEVKARLKHDDTVLRMLIGHKTALVEYAYRVWLSNGIWCTSELSISDRKYPMVDGFMGTMDCIWTILKPEGREVNIFDWKTGDSYVDDPSQNYQFLLAAIYARHAFHTDNIRGHLVNLDRGTRASTQLTPNILDAAENALVDLLRKISSRVLETNVGTHCRYCPSRNICPAVHEQSGGVGQSLAERVDKAFFMSLELEETMSLLKRELDKMADDQGHALISGESSQMYLARTKSEVESIASDNDAILRVVSGAGVEQVPGTPLFKTTTSTTKAMLEKAFGKKAFNGTVLPALRNAGLTLKSERVKYEFKDEGDGE